MNIYEKVGDFLFNLVNLIVGGIIFAAIMSQESYPSKLYIITITGIILLFIHVVHCSYWSSYFRDCCLWGRTTFRTSRKKTAHTYPIIASLFVGSVAGR